MIPRYKTEKTRKEAETIFKLRQKGHTYQAIGEHVGQSYQAVMQKYKRECHFREQAFRYPFIEYISGHTEKVIRQSLGENLLTKPEKLRTPEAIKAILFWPGVGDGTLQDLADGLFEAGFEFFDPVKLKRDSFSAGSFKALKQ